MSPPANGQLQRITWRFRHPLETAITVLEDAAYPLGSSRPYHQPSQHSEGHYGLHEISQEPITTPPVSSIDVECQEWDAWHSIMISDYDGEEELVYDNDFCPPPSPVLVVTASSEKGYETVHDYITQMWPWLFKHRYMIIKSEDPDEVEQLLETEWVIDMGGVGSLAHCEREGWPEVQKNAAARIMREREGKKLTSE
ncbi:UDP-N-acetylglucosamine pyrophosphorylase [Beauveria brongniartii RCEF 3172]|uniref:UDP-N-acetylglucosamine pyrophosphorylase n=1 Tax=Beauveria brongniartii RCEF 3172 TaxID=1081107 RepID=A0A162LSX4_9HYPO|nr:UDP-N-acetylglucosamine pyrophosphorylase [Beauveria brongniartii RCEF 3172]